MTSSILLFLPPSYVQTFCQASGSQTQSQSSSKSHPSKNNWPEHSYSRIEHNLLHAGIGGTPEKTGCRIGASHKLFVLLWWEFYIFHAEKSLWSGVRANGTDSEGTVCIAERKTSSHNITTSHCFLTPRIMIENSKLRRLYQLCFVLHLLKVGVVRCSKIYCLKYNMF